MPTWRRKITSPLSFNLGAAVAVSITGDSQWAWLSDWLPVMGDPMVLTEPFCEHGPPSPAELSPLDFNVADANPYVRAFNMALLGAKLVPWAMARMFAAYCELPATVGWSTETCESFGPVSAATYLDQRTRVPPAGATHFRVRQTEHDLLHGGGYGPDNMTEVYRYTPGTATYTLVVRYDRYGATPTDYTTVALTPGDSIVINTFEQSDRVTLCYAWEDAGATPYVPPVLSPPANVIPPTTRTYETIADLGRELDRQEFKLDMLGTQVAAVNASVPMIANGLVDAPVPAPSDTEVAIEGAIAVIVTLASIPAWADEEFGTPPRMKAVGRVTLGTPTAWLPPLEITVSPMLIAPIPSGITRAVVSTRPTVAATVTMVRPPIRVT